MPSVSINKTALKNIEAHALQDFPNECCGFLFGKASVEKREITEAHAIKNSKEGDQKRRFEIHPLDYMKAERKALNENIQLLGIYHSHPLHPAIPSEHDLAQAQPSFSYFITSVEAEKIINTSSWILNDKNQFTEETINIKNQ